MKNIQREKGFLQIDKAEYQRERFCNQTIDGAYSYDWIILDGERYLFKKESKKESYSEVFWSYVLTYLKIQNVQYDLAKHDNFLGVITKDYNPNKLKVKSLDTVEKEYKNIIFKETGQKITRNLYNIQDLKKIYSKLYEGKYVTELIKDTFLKFIIQILFGDNDNHSKNTEILFTSHPQIAPFYDFGRYGKLPLKGSLDDYALRYLYEYEDEMEKPNRAFDTFMLYATHEELEILKEYMEKIKNINRKILFEEMEEKFHNKIPYFLKRNLEKKLLHNTKQAEKILKK